jgi:hypothetical protein
MNCCDAAGNCNQGRDCPARKATCRQRAGKPAKFDADVWIAKTEAQLEAELVKQWQRDLRAILFVASCILSFFLVALFWGMK